MEKEQDEARAPPGMDSAKVAQEYQEKLEKRSGPRWRRQAGRAMDEARDTTDRSLPGG